MISTHGTNALTTPSGSPLHRGRDGRKKTFQYNNAACRGFPKKSFNFKKLLRHFVPPPLFIEEVLVTLPEDREYFNSPSVYRGSTPKGGGSLKMTFEQPLRGGHSKF